MQQGGLSSRPAARGSGPAWNPPGGGAWTAGVKPYPRVAASPLSSIAATLRGLALAIVAGFVLWFLSDVVLLLFAAVLIAVILRGLADRLHRVTGMRLGLALACITAGLLVAVAALGYWIGPRVVSEGQQLAVEIAARVTQLQQQTGAPPSLARMVTRHLPHIGGGGGDGGALLRPELTLVRSTIGTLGSTFVVLVAAIYFAVAPMLYVNGAVRLVPVGYRPRARQILLLIAHALRFWSLGQCIDMAVVGTLSGVGLELAGVPLALALAIVAGLFTFVPYFGAIAASIPALVIAGTLGWSKVFWVIGVFLVCHGVEGYVVAPMVQRRTVELPPALTIMAMVLLGAAYGALGLILGTPVIASILVLVREAYVGDVLGDREAATPGPGSVAGRHPQPQPPRQQPG